MRGDSLLAGRPALGYPLPRSATLEARFMKTYKIAAIPGDGIGTEVVSAGVEALNALAKRDGGFAFKVDHSTGAASTTRSTAA